MKLIICGGGHVGGTIAEYLSYEGNDITVIDNDPAVIAGIAGRMDVRAIVGHAAHPDVLEQAGAYDAEMVIAATAVDEVNMTTCQMAHTLFHIPKKIARLRASVYHNPVWRHLFSAEHMPIDHIISPEREVAKAIINRLRVPGAFILTSMADSRVKIMGVVVEEGAAVIGVNVQNLSTQFPDILLRILCIIRGDDVIVPHEGDKIEMGDEVYMVVKTSDTEAALEVFGHFEREARDIVIMGGGNVGDAVLDLVDQSRSRLRAKIIETDEGRARYLAERHNDDIVLHGDALDTELLEEANVRESDGFLAVTNDDEANIIGSLMAKKLGCQHTMTLVNKGQYPSLLVSLGIDSVINPSAVTVSSIMRHVRRGNLKTVQALRNGFAEVVEGVVDATTTLVGKTLQDIKLPEGVRFGVILRGSDIMMARPDQRLNEGDTIILFALKDNVRDVERLFSVRGGRF